MGLDEAPLILSLLGVTAYVVLGGADFGAGFWFLLAGRDNRVREHTFASMGPVWEANHVWLIFVLVVCWTAYPVAFASIASTLAAPLFLATIGVILRGAAYALRSGSPTPRQDYVIGLVFSVSSIFTPFALGTAVGGIASGRVPVGNAEGQLFTSWLNPTSLLIGVLAVATSAYLAAVFLAADAGRQRDASMRDAFRRRALISGAAAGLIAFGGLAVVQIDAPELFDGLTGGPGLAALVASLAAGIVTMTLVTRGRFEPARYSASVAVGAVVAGWGLAQSPTFLPGLTVEQAAAGRSTLVPLLVGLAIGALILIPSLFILFKLVLGGRFDPGGVKTSITSARASSSRGQSPRLAMLAAFGTLAAVLLMVASAAWLQLATALMLLIAVALLLPALVGRELDPSLDTQERDHWRRQ